MGYIASGNRRVIVLSFAVLLTAACAPSCSSPAQGTLRASHGGTKFYRQLIITSAGRILGDGAEVNELGTYPKARLVYTQLSELGGSPAQKFVSSAVQYREDQAVVWFGREDVSFVGGHESYQIRRLYVRSGAQKTVEFSVSDNYINIFDLPIETMIGKPDSGPPSVRLMFAGNMLAMASVDCPLEKGMGTARRSYDSNGYPVEDSQDTFDVINAPAKLNVMEYLKVCYEVQWDLIPPAVTNRWSAPVRMSMESVRGTKR